ncbi:MAG: translation initiation factor [Verrucomicrobiota bacterium]
MRPEPKKRVDTNASQATRPGLNHAFAGIDLPNLPPAPVAEPQKSAPPPAAKSPWKLGRVVLRRESAHRGGKTVIVVDDFAQHLPESVLEKLAKKLRAACGCGGTMKERTIEIQGDQPGKIRELLEAEGFQVAGVR